MLLSTLFSIVSILLSIVSIFLLAWTFTALCSSIKVSTNLLRFKIACSTGEVNCGSCGGCGVGAHCEYVGGAYCGGFGPYKRFKWFPQLGL